MYASHFKSHLTNSLVDYGVAFKTLKCSVAHSMSNILRIAILSYLKVKNVNMSVISALKKLRPQNCHKFEPT